MEDLHLKMNEALSNSKEEELEESSVQDAMAELSLVEEIKRIDNFDKAFIPNGCVKESDIFNSGITVAQTIIAMTKEMVNNGIDYNNALAVANNHIIYIQELEKLKTQQVQLQQNMI